MIRAVLDGATVTACIEHLRHLQGGEDGTGPIVTAPLAQDTFLAGIADDPRLSGVAGSILGAAPVPFGCTYLVKEPRCGLPVWWHQDGHPWRTRLGITEAVTLWIALDSAGAENGGLRVIPGSHVLDAQPLRPRVDPPSVFGSEIDPALVDEPRARLLTLAPGDVSAHHPNLIHGSAPNRSSDHRRALAVRYRPA